MIALRLSTLVPLLPVLILSGYILVGFILFVARVGHLPEAGFDREVEKRSASPILGRLPRHFLMWMISPWERQLVRIGVSPNAITIASFLIACGSTIALALGHFAIGGWLYLLAGILDVLDGRVARKTGRVTRGGAYVDSVIDRYVELVVLSGFAIFYRNSWALGVVLAAAIGSVMVSYAKARGEGLGVDVNVGVMQRPERLFYLGIVTATSPVVEALWGHGRFPPFVAAIFALAMLAASANLTAVRRILHTMALLDGRPLSPTAERINEYEQGIFIRR